MRLKAAIVLLMNASLPDTHPSIRYYDSDYPSQELSKYPENLDATMELQGLVHDVARYDELGRASGGPILELCCGTGRVAIPLARRGHRVVAVDLSSAMLELFQERLSAEAPEVVERISLVKQDVTRLALPTCDFPVAIMPFNSLMCLTEFQQQCDAITAAAAHLQPGGLLVLDLVNPFVLPLAGDESPKPFFTRRNPQSGYRYTRFAALGPMSANQVQRLWGWYDEVSDDGILRRTEYTMDWRLIFRYELELMLERAGLETLSVEGGHKREPFTRLSRKLFVIATKPAEARH